MKISKGFKISVTITGILCLAATQLAAQTVSTQDYNKLVVMKYMEAYGTSLRRDFEEEYFSEDYERIRSEFHNMQYHASDSELMDSAQPLSISLQNRRDSVDVIMAEGDAVAVRYKINGTHAGNLYGIPATGKSFEIDAGAIFWLEDGKVSKGWFMADEAGLLKAIGQPLPARKDGRWEAAPQVFSAITGDQHLKELLENPVDSQAYRNKLVINSYKSKNPPEELKLTPDQYGLGLRRGFMNLGTSATPEMVEKYPFGGAFPDREDMIVKMMADGKWVMILFRLTATNSESLFGIPALDRKVSAYEFGFMEFDGEDWAYRWFFGDDLGMLLQMGGPQDYWFTGGQ